jgi:hypothetical protein
VADVEVDVAVSVELLRGRMLAYEFDMDTVFLVLEKRWSYLRCF